MNFFRKSKHLTVLTLIFVLCAQFVFAIDDSQIDNYRIMIHKTSSSTTIKVNNGYEIYIDDVKVLYDLSASGEDITFIKTNNSISVQSATKTLGTGDVVKLIKKDTAVKYFEVKNIDSVAYAKYPDNATVRLDSNKSMLLVINETPIETYLKGVIPHEIGVNAPLEAMKAQAVTARTVAVNRVNKYAVDGYDITNTTSDQVYKGYSETYFASSHNVSKAVDGTKGIVLTYNGALVEGMFYSNNGGQTASDGSVWGSGVSTSYYKSKSDPYDTYLHKSIAGWSKISYEEIYTKEELRNVILNNSKLYSPYFKTPYCTPSFNGLSENFTLEVMSSNNGYVTQIRLSDDTGRVYNIKNYANRWFFGLRSQQYSVTQAGGLFVKSNSSTVNSEKIYVKNANGDVVQVDKSSLKIKGTQTVSSVDPMKYVFSGKGYGHGVGMSQNGAMNRAEAGQTYTDILNFYYEGTKTVSNYGK